MISAHQRQLRDRFLSAPVMLTPDPWRPLFGTYGNGPGSRPSHVPIGGLLGVGFALDPVTGEDLLMIVSHQGRGVFDTSTGVRIARDPNPDASMPTGPDLSCPGLGPLAGTHIRIAGLFGGGLHTTTDDGWTTEIVSPDWPYHRVLLSADGGLCDGPPGERWWHIFHADYSELRAAGFSPSGRTLAVATSSDITLWTRDLSPAIVRP
ncbi:hypothetical protein [Microtetraspora malaysiensis]|uniref:hypothetical protein n=1 Tax=Microtetraspora malaysiensis TaxID=161358 RepID=UPI000A042623|nr:hypothetical protein [Microtetraspora malaysiensis]